MPHEIRTEIEIDAPADRIWSVLTDFPAMDEALKARGEGQA